MTRIKIFSVILLVFVNVASAGWIRTYGGGTYTVRDWGMCIQETSDSAYIVCGFTASFGDSKEDLWLLKIDRDGDTVWTRTYGSPGLRDQGYVVRQTTDGGFIITGIVNLGGDTLSSQLWLLKTDADGDTLWTRVYGDSSHFTYGNCVQQTSDGGYVITGRISGEHYSDVWLLKTDSLGDTTWTRTFDGDAWDVGYWVLQTPDNGYILDCIYDYGVDGGYAVWLIKTDSLGDTLWTRQYKSGKSSWAYSMDQTTEGGFIFTGAASPEDPDTGLVRNELWLVKTDSAGDTLWTKTYGDGFGDVMEQGLSVQQTSDGGYIVVGFKGTTLSTIWLLKTDSQGDTLWTREFGGVVDDGGESVIQTSDGGYIITGRMNNDLCVIKVDSLGLLGIEEPTEPLIPVTHRPDFQVMIAVGREIAIRYSNPLGASTLTIEVYDASGRKVDQVHSTGQSGTLSWGNGHGPGVYFIKLEGDYSQAQKVVLVR